MRESTAWWIIGVHAVWAGGMTGQATTVSGSAPSLGGRVGWLGKSLACRETRLRVGEVKWSKGRIRLPHSFLTPGCAGWIRLACGSGGGLWGILVWDREDSVPGFTSTCEMCKQQVGNRTDEKLSQRQRNCLTQFHGIKAQRSVLHRVRLRQRGALGLWIPSVRAMSFSTGLDSALNDQATNSIVPYVSTERHRASQPKRWDCYPAVVVCSACLLRHCVAGEVGESP